MPHFLCLKHTISILSDFLFFFSATVAKAIPSFESFFSHCTYPILVFTWILHDMPCDGLWKWILLSQDSLSLYSIELFQVSYLLFLSFSVPKFFLILVLNLIGMIPNSLVPLIDFLIYYCVSRASTHFVQGMIPNSLVHLIDFLICYCVSRASTHFLVFVSLPLFGFSIIGHPSGKMQLRIKFYVLCVYHIMLRVFPFGHGLISVIA